MVRLPRGGSLVLWSLVCSPLLAQQQPAADNLARTAAASASEDYGAGLAPGFANDGDLATRWSAIPGHNSGVWYQLDWPRPVTFRQVVLHQFDTFVMELDVEVWDAAQQGWRALRHCGVQGRRLPLVVVADVDPVTTDKLRIAGITNGPSFTEVEVYAAPVPPVTVLGADLCGNLIGEVCDAWGSAPIAGAAVELRGDAAGGAWQSAMSSDEHGMFTAPMPLGLCGEVAVRTIVAGGVHASTVAATGLQYGLLPWTPGDGQCLDGDWKFLVDPPAGFAAIAVDDAAWPSIAVPGHWSMQGFRARVAGGYRRHFDARGGAGRWLLRFDGVYSGAQVWVNGTLVATHDGGAVPFEVDVTDLVQAKDNVLAVLATERTPASLQLDKMSEYADMDLGGIFRSVWLRTVPALHLGAVALATAFAADGEAATVSGTVSLLDASMATMNDVELRVSLREPGGGEVASAVVPTALAAWTRCDLPVSLVVPKPKGWNAEQPFLYDLAFELRAGGKTVQTVRQRFGLRQTAVRGSELLVNGHPVKLRGACHHDSDPLRGRAVTDALQRRDVELMREANLNALRTSHYPPQEALLLAADELGMYVEDEASFCWTSATDDLRLLPRVVQLIAEMVARDRNHASVTLWSLCNESRVGSGLWRAREVLRRLDPSRPVAGSWAPDGSLDFAVRHNPITLAGIDEVEHGLKAPVLWDESWCIWQDIWSDAAELWLDPGLRDAYVAPLPAIYERFAHSPVVQGTMIWAWSDDIFLLPGAGLEYGRGSSRVHFAQEQYSMLGRGMVGDAQWGVVDGWRRRKPEFLHTRKLHSPVRIAATPLPAERSVRIPVENQYDFLNLSNLRFDWQLGEDRGTVTTDVPPRGRGVLAIELPRQPRPGEPLSLQISDRPGRWIDEVLLAMGAAPRPAADPGAAGPALSLRTEHRLSGATTFVRGQDFELGLGEQLGDLRRGVGFGAQLLRSLPVLHVLATGRPEAPLPTAASWRLTHFAAARDGDDAKVTVGGHHDGFEGGYVYCIRRDGRIEAQADFVYTGAPLQVREVGLSFTVPRANDMLQWARRREWGLYPQDHIGRPWGRARAVAVHGAELPPSWPWAEDNTPLGCNDFRSSKRAIERGWIGLLDGPGVAIESDGSQNLRATVDGEHIDVVVTDYLGGSDGIGEWTSNYGTGRRLQKGEKLTAHVVLRLVGNAPPLGQ